MYIQPHSELGGELARQKQRDMIAQAQRLNGAREARDQTQISRRATWAERWLVRGLKRRRPAAVAPERPLADYVSQEGDGLVVDVELIHPGARG